MRLQLVERQPRALTKHDAGVHDLAPGIVRYCYDCTLQHGRMSRDGVFDFDRINVLHLDHRGRLGRGGAALPGRSRPSRSARVTDPCRRSPRPAAGVHRHGGLRSAAGRRRSLRRMPPGCRGRGPIRELFRHAAWIPVGAQAVRPCPRCPCGYRRGDAPSCRHKVTNASTAHDYLSSKGDRPR